MKGGGPSVRSIRTVAVFLLVLLVAFVSCSDNVANKLGTLEINIDTSASRGMQAISMDTTSYNVVVRNSDNEIVFNSSRSTRTSYAISVPAGTYSVVVEAVNKTGDVIGTGSLSADIVAGQTNSFSITITEPSGSGTFRMAITADAGYEIAYTIKSAGGTTVKSGSLSYSEGVYSAVETLANGFYTFTITRADSGKVLKYDSLRIIKDRTVTYEATFRFMLDGSITIVNEIVPSPSIAITFDKAKYSPSDTLIATADISGIIGTSFHWIVDEIAQEETNIYEDLSLDLSAFANGDHVVALFVSDGTKIWSESATFSISNSLLLPVTIYDLQTAPIAKNNPYNGNFRNFDSNTFIPIPLYGLLSPSFARLEERELDSDSNYETKISGITVSCSVTEEGDYYVIEGTSESGDEFIYYRLKKDYSELSFIEAEIFRVEAEGKPQCAEQVMLHYAPQITISNGVCEGQSFMLYYMGGEYAQNQVEYSHIYLYSDSDFIGQANIVEETLVELSVVPSSVLTLDNMLSITGDPAVAALANPVPGTYTGSIVFYDSVNDYTFDSEMPMFNSDFAGHPLAEFTEEASRLNPNWILTF